MGRRFGESHYRNNLHISEVVIESYKAVPFIFAGVVLTSCQFLKKLSDKTDHSIYPKSNLSKGSYFVLPKRTPAKEVINLLEKVPENFDQFCRKTGGAQKSILRKVAYDLKCSSEGSSSYEFRFEAEGANYQELVDVFEKVYEEIKCVGIIDTAE